MTKESKNAAPIIEEFFKIYNIDFIQLGTEITLNYKINQGIFTSIFLEDLIIFCKRNKLWFALKELFGGFEISFHLVNEV